MSRGEINDIGPVSRIGGAELAVPQRVHAVVAAVQAAVRVTGRGPLPVVLRGPGGISRIGIYREILPDLEGKMALVVGVRLQARNASTDALDPYVWIRRRSIVQHHLA